MAETWAQARQNRELRELAGDRPKEAMRMIRGFLDAVEADGAEELGIADTEVAAVLARPPRQRNATIRALVEHRRATQAGGRSAEDRERIEALTSERDQLAEQLNRTPAAQEILDGLTDAEKLLSDLLETVKRAATAGLPELACRKILRWGDQLHEVVDTILDAAARPREEDA